MDITIEDVTPDESATPVVAAFSSNAVNHAASLLFEHLRQGLSYTPVFTVTVDGTTVNGRLIASATLVASQTRFMAQVVTPPVALEKYILLLELERTPSGQWSGELHVVEPNQTGKVWIDFRESCFVREG